MAETPPFPCPTKGWHSQEQPATSPTRPELSAKGKTVVVTGGGNTGIGGETARKYAQAGAARLVLLGRREKPLLENKAWIESNYPNVKVVTIPTDITVQSSVEAAFSKIGADGKVDVLIHSAATIGPKEPITVADGNAFISGINTNVTGSLWLAQSFCRHAKEDAVVVAISSFGAHLTLGNLFDSYCVAKLAVFRIWDEVGHANPGMRIYHTQPGVIITEMNLREGGADSFKDIKADDVSLPACFNLWLASPEAAFLKGKFLWCNWDVEELKAQAKEIESSTKLNIGLVGWPFADTK